MDDAHNETADGGDAQVQAEEQVKKTPEERAQEYAD